MSTAGNALIDPKKIFAKVGLAKGMRVADFGCGRTGHFVFSAARKVGDTGMVYAVDIVKNVLESIQSRIRSEGYDNVHTIWSDVESVGKAAIPEESLDGCFVINILSLAKDKQNILEEASRLLKKNGFVAIIDWKNSMGNVGPASEMMVVPESLLPIALKYNLKLIHNFEQGKYHYCMIFKKE